MTTNTDGDHLRLLLIEDQMGDARLTEIAFAQADFDTAIDVVTSGGEALEYLYRRGEYEDAPRPQVVLVDLNLRGMHGMEVLQAIKQDPELRTIPVVILSNSSSDEDVVEAYERYANSYLTKPVDVDQFVALAQSFSEYWSERVMLPPMEA